MPKRSRTTAALPMRRRYTPKRARKTILYKAPTPFVDQRYLDSRFLALGASTTYQIHGLNAIAAGDDIFQRSSRRITCKTLSYKFNIFPNTASTNMHYWRFAIVYDRESYTLPTYQSVWEGTSGGGAVTSDVYSFPNINNKTRFTILRDHRFMTATSYNPPGTAGDFSVDGSLIKQFLPIEGFIRLDRIAEYGSTGFANPISGALYAFIINDDFAPVAVDWNYNLSTRVVFTSQ